MTLTERSRETAVRDDAAEDSKRDGGTDRLDAAQAVLAEFLESVRGDGEAGADGELVLESLEASELKAMAEMELGASVSIEQLLECSTGGEIAGLLAEAASEDGPDDPSLRRIEPDPENRHSPFPLTEIQSAYLMGRSASFELGEGTGSASVSTHVYLEFDAVDLDVDRLGSAFAKLIERHDMLRAVIGDDGRQRVLESVEPYEIRVEDLSERSSDEVSERLAETRDELSHQVLPADRWPVFDVRVTRLAASDFLIHLSLDLLILDGPSIRLLLDEWSALYSDPDAALPPLELSFRDYVLAVERLRETPAYDAARDYWVERLDSLPPAPDLPLAATEVSGPPRFARRREVLNPACWAAIKREARAHDLSAAGLLCAAYAEVLANWAKEPRFCVNVTLAQRLPLHPDVGRIVGDFTSSALLAVDAAHEARFEERARTIQQQLRRDLDHSLFGGVEVLREMARRRKLPALGMPVVFTGMLGGDESREDDSPSPFECYVDGVSQTPQVLLDCQVVERAGELNITWDAVEAAFPEGMLDAMFEAYGRLLRALSEDGAPEWEVIRPRLLPADQLELLREANATARDLPRADESLHGLVDAQVEARRDEPAVIEGTRTLTYAELDRRANRVARRLRELGAERNSLVAVCMDKGSEQVVAVLGVLRSGAAYLPVDASLPRRRRELLLERGGARIVLTQRHVDERGEWPEGATVLRVDAEDDWADVEDSAVDPVGDRDDLAYVIFTSGSTGTPSGVMVQHAAVVNTLADMVDRFELGPDDRVLALSSLSFDLSVFDIFGTLGAGGAIVIPEQEAAQDPARWADLVREQRVTVWNSVPALLEMLVEYAAGQRDAVGSSIRLALLSGDWIPLTLPDAVREIFADAQVVSLGGATEGSIWSILHPIGEVEPHWSSVPYGRPMANQRMHVLDGQLRPRPLWVPGEIFIGGAGVAAGYWREDEKTEERFVEHPCTGERLYRTGDLGRWLPSGDMEFLGRADFQVKIRGHRVELAEIEAALAEHDAVGQAVATALGDRDESKRLAAYVVPADGSLPPEAELRDFLDERLPDYMVPTAFVPMDELPLNANGKVDVSSLPEPDWGGTAEGGGSHSEAADGGDVRDKVAALWRDALGVSEVAYDRGFLDYGGDSLLAMRVIAKAGAAGIRLQPKDFLDNPTVDDLAAAASTGAESPYEQGLVAGDVGFSPAQLWFLDHDFDEAHHWNGMWPLLEVRERLDPCLLGAAVHAVAVHHDMLRMRLGRAPDGWSAEIAGADGALPVPFSWLDLSEANEEEARAIVRRTCEERQASLSLEEGPAIRITYFDLGDRPGRLHVAAHWIAVDYYSSRLVFEDLLTAYEQLRAGESPRLPAKTAPFEEYVETLREQAAEVDADAAAKPWLTDEYLGVAPLPRDGDGGSNRGSTQRRVIVTLEREATERLVHELTRAEGCEVREAVLAGLARAVSRWTGERDSLWEVESHGRDEAAEGVDISRTVGRCSTLTPVLVSAEPEDPPVDTLAAAMASMRRCGSAGAGYGTLRYLTGGEAARRLAEAPAPELGWNFWGNVDEYFTDTIWPSAESPGPHRSPAGERPRLIDVLGFIVAGQLALVWSYSSSCHRAETIRTVAEDSVRELHALACGEGSLEVTALEIDEERGVDNSDDWLLPAAAMGQMA